MILNSIELENIRSYNKESIEFPRGITLFEGDIGSGKSTVLMGIEFALFGLGSQKAESLLAKKAKQGSVTLKFQVDGTVYEIKRILKRHDTSVRQDAKNSYLKVGDELEPLSPTELKQRVLQILKFNEPTSPTSESRIFRYAVFTPQEEMKVILRDPGRRLETIRKAFGVEDYKVASENAKEVVYAIKNSMAEFKGRFGNVDELRSELTQSEKEKKEITSTIEKLGSKETILAKDEKSKYDELEQSRTKLQEKTKLEGQQEKIQSKIEGSEHHLETYQNQITENESELEDIIKDLETSAKIQKPTTKTVAQIQKEIKEFGKLNDDIISSKSTIDSLLDNIQSLEDTLGAHKKSKIKVLEERLGELNNLKKADEKELESLENTRDKQNEKKIKLEKTVEDLKESISDVSKLGSKCPYCEHPLTASHKKKLEKERNEKLVKSETELASIDKDFKKIISEITKLESSISKYEEEIEEIEDIIPNLQELEKKNSSLNKFQASLKNFESKNKIPEEKAFPNDGTYEDPLSYLDALKEALLHYENSEKHSQDLKNRQEKAKKAIEKTKAQIGTTNNDISNLKQDLIGISKKLEFFRGLDQEISKKKQELDELQVQLRQIRDEISTKKANLENENSKMKKISNDIEQADKWKKKHEKFRHYHDWLKDFFIPTIDQIEKQVLLSIQQTFNETYRKWYSILLDDPTKESRIDENFTPIIEQDGYEQDIDYLSGGEKTSIALAYRLTLNSMMRQETDSLKSNLLILDEPTDGFSKTQLSKVRSLLQELHSEQIILVSHEKELETYVDNIFQISKESGLSKITRLIN